MITKKKGMSVRPLALFLVGLMTLAVGSAQEGGDISGLKIKYLDAKSRIQENKEAGRGSLFSGYAAAVEKLQADFQQQGDLQNAVRAKQEAELARTQESGEEDFPGIGELRTKLQNALEELEASASADLKTLNEFYASRLIESRDALTKAGQLELALKVDEEIKEVEEELSELGAAGEGEAPSDLTSQAPKGAVEVEIHDSYVNNTKLRSDALTGEVAIQVGKHRMKDERATVGNREVPKGEKPQRGIIRLSSGTTIEGGEIYVDVGELYAKETRFENVRLMANLGGQMVASSCLFDECTLQKAGGWFSGYSSKWTFHNSVMRKTIAGGEFNRGAVGLKLTFCTFVDVEFPKIEYNSDAGREAQESWRTIENCRFIGCKVPRSVLLMTKNCIFEDCEFPTKGDSRPNGTTALEVTLYHNGLAFSPPAKFGPSTFKVEDGRGLNPVPGSTVLYDSGPNDLVFR